ncbi:MAG: cupin domain-containing protein [Proteobacteria bacterium]|nr:cupin domain-containing protein [Pseudomonadota bacterium]
MAFFMEKNIDKEIIGSGRKRYLCHTDSLMLVIIDFDDGPSAAPDPPHSHPHEQISYVAAGELIVHIGDEVTELKQGDIFAVPPNVPHTIQLLSNHVRLVDTFTPLREDFLK